MTGAHTGSGAAFASRAAKAADLWGDLFATALVRARAIGSGPPVVLTDTMRVWPLLETQGPVGWVHARPCLYQDYAWVKQGQPAARDRIEAHRRPADAVRLLRRAGLCIVAVPSNREAAAAMAALAAKAQQARAPLLVYGPSNAAGWPAFEALLRQAALQSISGPGLKAFVSAGLTGAVGPSGLCDAERALAVATQLSRARQADVHAEALPDGGLRLRLRIDPVHLVAAGSPTLAHQVVHEGRALLNSRGLGALLLPWSAPAQVRLLLRNVRARIDSAAFALGHETMAPSWVDYTDHGAMVRLSLPGVSPERDGLLHLSLPRDAVPSDGFCDIGAAEFTIEG